jgi:hypothetical protein
VFTHKVHAYYIWNSRNRFKEPVGSFFNPQTDLSNQSRHEEIADHYLGFADRSRLGSGLFRLAALP